MLAILASCGCIAMSAVPAVPAKPQQFPSCVVACAYGALKQLGHEVPLDQLVLRFRQIEHSGNLDKLSLTSLREVLESYGLHAAAVTVNIDSLNNTPTPAIIYLRPEAIGMHEVGHVALLQRMDDENAVVVDLVIHGGSRSISMDELRRFWKGEALLVSKYPIPTPVSKWPKLAMTASAVFLVLALFSLRRRMANHGRR